MVDAAGALAQLSQAGAATSEQLYPLGVLTAATDPTAAGARLAVAAEVPSVHQAQARHLLEAVTSATGQSNQAFAFATVGIALVQLEEWPLAEFSLRGPSMPTTVSRTRLRIWDWHRIGRAKMASQPWLRPPPSRPNSPLISFLYGLHFRGLASRPGPSRGCIRPRPRTQANPAIAADPRGAYAATGDLTNGEEWFRKAVSLNDRDGQFWLLLARFYVDREYKVADEGLPASRMAVGLNPTSALAADALGYALILTGDGLTGKQELERALTIDPNLAAAHYHLGVYYVGVGQVEKAEPYFNQVLALDPQGPYGDLALKAKALISPPP